MTPDERVEYADIPAEARDVLDEVYLPEGVEIFYNACNRLLDGRRPRDCDLPLVVVLANGLADGNFA